MIPATLLFCVTIATGFNIETRNLHVAKPLHIQNGSWFGHGIVLQPVRSGELTAYVSAPRQTRKKKSDRNSTSDAPDGAIHRCTFKLNFHGEPSCTTKYIGYNSAVGMTMQTMKNDQLLVCGPQWIHLCRKAPLPQRMVGACYLLNTTNFLDDTSSQLPSPCVTDCTGGMDIVFLLDGSGSVSKSDFDIAKTWLINVTAGFSEDMGYGDVNVGVIQYSGTTNISVCDEGILRRYLKIELPLRNYNHSSARKKIVKATKLGQCTLTGDAINATVDEFLSRGRKGNAAVMVVITDGRSTDSVTEAANHARNNDISMIAVGVGPRFVMQELVIITNDTKRIFTVANYSSLNSILVGLQEAILLAGTSYLEGGSGNSTSELTECTMGMSAIHSKNNAIHIGAPGAYNGKGTVISRTSKNLTLTHNLLGPVMDSRMHENGFLIKDSYLGYSMASGFFRGGEEEWIAVGIPRYYGYGAVALYKAKEQYLSEHNSLLILAPEDKKGVRQIGTYFGHTLLAADINNDEADELIVGAPLYSHRGASSYDEGCVTIYRRNPGSSDMSSMTRTSCMLKGFQSNSRLGMSLAKAGDLDRDSYMDIVISAPGFDNGRGEIVVFYGGEGCPIRHQRVSPRIPGSDISYFGFSLASTDNSEISNVPLLVASLPKSGGLVLLKSRPVVDLTATLDVFILNDKNSDKLDVIQCAERQSKELPCVAVRECFHINWRDEKQMSNNGTIDVYHELVLDAEVEEKSKRMVFSEEKKQQHHRAAATYHITTEKRCMNYSLQMKPNILFEVNAVKFSNPVVIKLFVNMSKKFDDVIMSPMLSESHVITYSKFDFVKGCVTGGNCLHDLALHVDAPADDPIKIYTPSELVRVNVTVENKADPSCFTKLSVATQTAIITEVNSNCAVLDDNRETLSIKDNIIGALLWPNQTCAVQIAFSILSPVEFAKKAFLEVKFSVYSLLSDKLKAIDNTPGNNEAVIHQNVLFFASFSIKSVALPGDMHYWRNISDINTFTSLTEKGIFGGENGDIVNLYTVSNTGPFAVPKVDLSFAWPAVTREKELLLLYLFDFSCQPASVCSCKSEQQCDTVNSRKLPYDNFTNPNGIYTKAQCQVTGNLSRKNTDFKFSFPRGYPLLKRNLDCSTLNSTVKCHELFCELSGLQPSQTVEIVGRFKLWIPTFHLKQENSVVYVASSVELSTHRSTAFSKVEHQRSAVTSTKQYFVLPEKPEPPRRLNIALILVAVVIGLVLVALITFCCWKCGYFESKYKKKRSMILTEEEQELGQNLIASGTSRRSSEWQAQPSHTSSAKEASGVVSSAVTSQDVIHASTSPPTSKINETEELYLEMTPMKNDSARPTNLQFHHMGPAGSLSSSAVKTSP